MITMQTHMQQKWLELLYILTNVIQYLFRISKNQLHSYCHYQMANQGFLDDVERIILHAVKVFSQQLMCGDILDWKGCAEHNGCKSIW